MYNNQNDIICSVTMNLLRNISSHFSLPLFFVAGITGVFLPVGTAFSVNEFPTGQGHKDATLAPQGQGQPIIQWKSSSEWRYLGNVAIPTNNVTMDNMTCDGNSLCTWGAYHTDWYGAVLMQWKGTITTKGVQTVEVSSGTSKATIQVSGIFDKDDGPYISMIEQNTANDLASQIKSRPTAGNESESWYGSSSTRKFRTSHDEGDVVWHVYRENTYIGTTKTCKDRYGCSARTAVYFVPYSGKSGTLKLYAKFIKGSLEPGVYTFTVPVMTLNSDFITGHGTGSINETATLNVTATLHVPQRCYILGDGMSPPATTTNSLPARNGEIKFKDVQPGAGLGVVEEKTYKVTSECFGLSGNVEQSLSVNYGDNTTQYNQITVEKDKDNNDALALRMRISDDTTSVGNLCNTGELPFNKPYTNYFQGPGTNDNTYTYISKTNYIHFLLCKYGMPASFGERSINLTIKSKWTQQ